MKRPALAGLTALGLLALLIMVATTLMAIATRFLGIVGLEWSYEVAGIAFVWTTFLGAAVAEVGRENAAFEVLRARLPGGWRSGLDRLGALVLLGVGTALAASGVAALWRSGWVPTPLLRWPGGVQTAAAPALGACLSLAALPRLFGRRPPPDPDRAAALTDDGTGTPL